MTTFDPAYGGLLVFIVGSAVLFACCCCEYRIRRMLGFRTRRGLSTAVTLDLDEDEVTGPLLWEPVFEPIFEGSWTKIMASCF